MSDLCLQRPWEENGPVAKIQEEPVEEEGEKGASAQGSWQPPQGMAAVLVCQRHSSSLSLRSSSSQAFPPWARNSVLVSPASLWGLKEGNGKKQERIAGDLGCLQEYASPTGSCAGVWWQPVEVGWFQGQSVAWLCWDKWLGWEDAVLNLWFVWVMEWQTVIKTYSSKSIWPPEWFATALLSLKHCFLFPKSPLRSGMGSEVAFS